MIPQTFPSKAAGSDGGAVMQAKFLTDVTGLVRWTDYIPVKLKTGGVQDSTDNNGFISIEQAVLTASSKAFVDYYPVYVDNAATKAWECSADGYIPYAPHNTASCSLVLDFTNGAALDSRVTFTRTTGASNPATYVNSSGVVTSATNNQPRFDYDPVTLACKGLLIEEARTNILTYSSDFSTSWVLSGATINSTATTAPDGTLTATKLIEDSGTSTHQIQQTNVFVADGVTRSWSLYVKQGERRYVAFSNGTLFSNSSNTLIFDTQVGAWTYGTPATGAFLTTQNAGNGWWRIAFNSASTSASYDNVLIGLCNGPSDYTAATYTGDGTSGVYIWGAQLEAGAFATSYIPTTTAALTRNADVATMTGTNFSDWFNASEGTFVADAYVPAVTGINAVFMARDNATANNRFHIYNQNGSQTFQIRSASTVVMLQSKNWGAKNAAAYKLDNSAFTVDAQSVSVDTSCAMPTSISELVFGPNNGVFRKFYYYPQRLTNAEVQAISK